jgi:uncharacterized protein YkwD
MRTWEKSLTAALLALILSVVVCGCGSVELPGATDAVTDVSAENATTELESAASIPADDCLALGAPSDETHQAIFDALNSFRVANGLEPLVYSQRLELAANAHVKDLYERNYFAHINPDGENPGKRAVEVGFCHEYVGENIAAGQKSVEAAEIAWENSPSHRENMLQPQYRYVGVGFYRDPNGRMYWAQEMAYDVPTGR